MKRILLTHYLFVFLGINLFAQQHFFRQYSNTESLTHSFVYGISQDSEGYLWIGTPDGLYKFNGFEFEHFTVESGMAHDFVTRIFKDSKERQWIGHQDGSISLQLKNGFTILKEHSEGQGAVSDFAEDPDGSIWFLTQNQELKLIDPNLKIKTVVFPREFESLTQIESIDNDLFILGSQESLFLTKYTRDGTSMEVLTCFDSYPGSKVMEIFPDAQEGYVVVSQEEGIYYLSSDSITGKYKLSAIDENLDGELENLQGGLLDSNGRLWFNSLGNGLFQYLAIPDKQYKRAERITIDNGLISDNVRSVFEDIEGNLWFGMYGDGLLKYVSNKLKFFDYSQEGKSKDVYALAGNSRDLLLVKGNRLLWINQYADTILDSYLLPEKARRDRVNAAYLTREGDIWLGFEQSGLFTLGFKDRNLRPVFLSNDELANSINHITGKENDIWVSTKRGIFLLDRKNGSKKWFTSNEGLPHNNVKQLHIDSLGRVLIATLCNEIHYIDKSQKIAVLENTSIGSLSSVVSFCEDQRGTLWVGTLGQGVWRIQKDSLGNFTRASGLLSDFCYCLAITKEGQAIVGHTGGISLINPESLVIKTFGRIDGVKGSSEFYANSILKDPTGNVWFGTSEGLVKYSVGHFKGDTIPPWLQINAVYVDGERINHTDGPVQLKPGRYEISVDYIGLSFTNPEMVFYQTMLEGYSRDWSDPNFNRNVVFQRVENGNYIFKVKAYNENEICSELSDAFEIRIRKPIYLAIWFYIAIATLLGIVFYLILQFRERSHMMIQEGLLNHLDEKSKEIIVKEEIIKERKKVEKVLIEAKTKAELSDNLKTSFLQNMSHEIRTPMNAIVGFSQLLGEDGLPEESRAEFIKNVSDNAENLLKLIDDILDLSKLETNQLKMRQNEQNVNALIHELESIFLKRLCNNSKEALDFIIFCPGDDDLEIITDKTRLKQILNNLLDNALKFTEAGSITLGYNLDRNNVTFFVEDTGIGLSDDKKDIVFDLFRKVEDDRFKLYGGTGLGLTISRYLVNMMGGEISVESEEEKGSKFYFTIPRKPLDDKSGNSNKLTSQS